MNIYSICMGFPGGAVVNNLPANAGDARDVGYILGQEDPPEEEMASCSSTPGLEICPDRAAWWATVHGVAKSRL